MTLMNELKELLKKDVRFIDSEGNLLKNRIVELALKLDKDLIKLLLENERIKNHFFKNIDGILVFDKEKFVMFIDNKEFLPDSYTAFKNKIGLANEEGKYLAKSKEVVLVWPYKDCVLEGGQEKPDEKRDEIFHNIVLAPDEIDRLLEPKVFTNFKRIDKNGEHKLEGFRRDSEINRKRGLPEDTITDNLIIKGNNLLVLHSLLKEFRGKIKLIYIDPPYNPQSAANTFCYNNNFNHSTWLTFMKNRIDAAKYLLSEDGFFCVSIDHNELFYLGVLCDEIFGRDNRIGIVAVETNPGGRSDSKFFATSGEYFLVYTKNIDKAKINDLPLSEEELREYRYEDNISRYKLVPLRRTGSNSTPDKRPNLYFPIYYNPETKEISVKNREGFIEIYPLGKDGTKRVWRWSKEKIIKNIENLEIREVNGKYTVFVKDRIRYSKKPKTVWYGARYDASTYGTKYLQQFNLAEDFSYPKSLYLVQDIIRILSDKNSIILDFTAGSGTTAEAVIRLNEEDGGNRQFILCEQMDYVHTITIGRLKRILDQIEKYDFVYMELMKLNEVFVEKIRDARTTEELLNVWEEMKHNGFLSYRVNSKLFDENIEEFKTLNLDEQKKLLLEMLDYNDLYVNYSEIDDAIYNVSKMDKKLNKEFYRGKENA